MTSLAIADVAAPPRWNLDTLFPGPESPELRAALNQAVRDIADLAAIFDEHRVGAEGAAEPPSVAAFEEVIGRYNAVLAWPCASRAISTAWLPPTSGTKLPKRRRENGAGSRLACPAWRRVSPPGLAAWTLAP